MKTLKGHTMKRIVLALFICVFSSTLVFAVTLRQRGDTAANWTSNNPTLEAREVGWETDTGKFKLGDGSTVWTSLSYITSAASTFVGSGSTTDAVDLATAEAAGVLPDANIHADIMRDSEVTKEIGWSLFNAETATEIADPLYGGVVPASMNGMDLIDVTCAVTGNITGATSGATTVVINRTRAGTEAVMTSTGVTIDYNAWSASDETVNTSNDDIATGDVIMAEVTGIVAGTAHTGLSCTAYFQ